MNQRLNTKLLRVSFSKLLMVLLCAGLFVSCAKKPSTAEATHVFLKNKPGDKGYEKNLKYLAEDLYQKKWGKRFSLVKPKFRVEKMQVEWEHQKTKKMKRKFSKTRCYSYVERFALSYMVSLTGPIKVDSLMKLPVYQEFCLKLNTLMTAKEIKKGLMAGLMSDRDDVLDHFGVSLVEAKENEKKYRVGILITAGFYLGFPIYKRITLDQHIKTRQEILRIYLHECGHQLFHQTRRFSKSIKLGLSWIGWRKSANSWWTVEEKSCNIFAELMLVDFETELKSHTLYAAYKKSLGASRWKRIKFVKGFKERYAALFFDQSYAMAKLYNKRVQSRYSTKDKTGLRLKSHLIKRGITNYLSEVNKCQDLKEVLLLVK